VSGSSFVLQQGFGLSVQQFGLAFGGGSISIISGMQLNPILVKARGSGAVLAASLVVGSLAGALLVASAAIQLAGVWGVLVPIWLFMASAGVALPNAPALALAGHGARAGTAAALLGCTQFAMAGAIGPLFDAVGLSALTMGLILLSGLVLALTVLLLVVRPFGAAADPAEVASVPLDPAYAFAH
jgi:DHA1 family bicyclomycin/chloramphenicol resistance-like MFS transporter